MWHLGGSSRMSSFADDGAWQAFPCCRFAFRFVSLDERCRFCHVSVYSAVLRRPDALAQVVFFAPMRFGFGEPLACGAAHMRRLRADRSAHERFATGDFPHCSVLAVRDDSHVGGAASRRLGSPRRCVGQCRHGELSCYVGIPFLGVLLPDGHFVWDVGFHGHECCGRRAPADWMELGNCPGRRRLGGDRCPSWSACVVIAGFGRLALAGCG